MVFVFGFVPCRIATCILYIVKVHIASSQHTFKSTIESCNSLSFRSLLLLELFEASCLMELFSFIYFMHDNVCGWKILISQA